MRISKFKLKNYVSFFDDNAEDVELVPGINFIVGKNNAGKTALLRALTSNPNENCPGNIGHRGLANIAAYSGQRWQKQINNFEVSYEFNRNELFRLLHQDRRTGWMAVPVRDDDELLQNVEDFLCEGIEICCTYHWGQLPSVRTSSLDDVRPANTSDQCRFIHFRATNIRDLELAESPVWRTFRDVEKEWNNIRNHIPRLIFRFDAERQIQPKSEVNETTELLADASNLAQVVNVLKGKQTALYNIYVGFVNEVFPSVQELLFDYTEGKVEILVGPLETSYTSPFYAVPLSKWGSGLAQALAILYVVIASDESRVIIIDEPQSFLHPEALRKLLEIFQLSDYSHHQYILSTHSPTALASVQDKHILLLERENMKSTITPIDPSKQADLELTLRNVGARLSDVFGMDSVIWVEGETDEDCFPMILRAHNVPLFGTKVLRLAHSGDFTNRKHGVTSVKLYRRLSAGEALLPPALAFVFDADLESELEHVKAEFGREARFLCRQNYESYLIDASAIACILKDDDPDNANEYSSDRVQEWIDNNHQLEQFYPKKPFDSESWQYSIDGANFLKELFGTVSETRVAYDKIEHTPRLTGLILQVNRDQFQEIVDLIQSILNESKSPEPA